MWGVFFVLVKKRLSQLHIFVDFPLIGLLIQAAPIATLAPVPCSTGDRKRPAVALNRCQYLCTLDDKKPIFIGLDDTNSGHMVWL